MIDIELMAKKKGISVGKVNYALTVAIEAALKEHFNLANVHIDFEEKIAEVIFRIPVDMPFREALAFDDAVLHCDPMSVSFDLILFPPEIEFII
jgi:hypothetical protein